MSDTLQDIYDYIDRNADEAIADLQELVRQPSISAQNVGLRDCAELVQRQMLRDGLDAQLHELDGGPPVIFGHMTTDTSAKTMLCYSHYDVQPPEPIEAWSHGGPWSGAVVDNVLYGRGATDNKSGVLAFNKAAKAFLIVRGRLPVNLKFIIEGEEEIGSIHLGPWVECNKALLEADGMHCLDGSVDTATLLPDVDLGLKSVLFVELVARGAKSDVHSLNFPLLPSPAWDLVRALGTIMDDQRRILIEDWYEGLYELEDEDEEQLRAKAARVDLDALRREWGIDRFALGRDGIDAIRARTYEPTANIQGLVAGYTGPGMKTIVPNEARAKLDFRLIPNIDPAKAVERLRRHLSKHGFGHIEVIARESAEPPYKISVKEDMSQAVIAAAHRVWGEAPIVNGVSAEGTILRHVWIPCVLTGFANPGANLHAPDENIRIDNYIRGIKYAAAIMEEFGRR
ncbi:M20/M25/M40 family metallo-hydrolase [Microvirga sp. BT689]|uniref:M20/M25/M40 family metallo-hydrolase n=1 Tax=Microvirga arvi TaxID=2778731 RepID=UPI0019501C61|nr:M20/M25/M40 family metallo-hydrolase [Microvirga arvi]MBM6581897.1 M20/M25/M40 family metallo-hydrolase [Microvirga arvi]